MRREQVPGPGNEGMWAFYEGENLVGYGYGRRPEAGVSPRVAPRSQLRKSGGGGQRSGATRPPTQQSRSTGQSRPTGEYPAQRSRPTGQSRPTGEYPAQRSQPTGQYPAQSRQPTGQYPAQFRQPTGQYPAQSRPPTGQSPYTVGQDVNRMRTRAQPPTQKGGSASRGGTLGLLWQRNRGKLIALAVVAVLLLVVWNILPGMLGMAYRHGTWVVASNPETAQTDVFVGHYEKGSDGTITKTHVIVSILRQQDGSSYGLSVLEIKGGDPAKTEIYPLAKLAAGQEHDQIGLVVEDLDGDHRPDLVISITDGDGSVHRYGLLNTGTEFRLLSQSHDTELLQKWDLIPSTN